MKRPCVRIIFLMFLMAMFVFVLGLPPGRAQEDEPEEDTPEETEQVEDAEPAPEPVETSPADDPFNERFIGLPRELAQRLEPVYFRKETVAGLTVLVPNPTAEIEKGLLELERAMPKESKLPLFRSRVEVALGRMDEARAAMESYMKLSGRNAEALLEYADFLHSRLSYSDELRALEERAQLLAKGNDADKQKAKADYLRIVKLITERRLTNFDRFDYYRRIVAMLPNDSGSAMEYVRALQAAGKDEEALKEAEKFTARFLGERREWFKVRAQILRKLGHDDAAVALYETLKPLDPPGLYGDYFAMLEDIGRLGSYRRSLEAASVSAEPADAKTMASWFRLMLYGSEDDKADRGIRAWIGKLEAAGRLKENLSLVGELLIQSNRAGSAAPYFYTLYATSNDPAAREDALWGLFRSLIQGDESSDIFAAGVAPGRDVLGLDNLPSVPGGILSLLLNDRQLNARVEDLDRASKAYRSRRMAARIADEMRRAFPRSAHLPDMDWDIMDTAALYKDWGTVEKLAIAVGIAYPNNYRYFESLFVLAGSFSSREKYAEEGQTYRRILDEASRRANNGIYLRAFNAYVATLTNQKKYLDALALYWEEIGRHPNDENLYEEFLQFAGTHNLYDQELKLYQRAIGQFGEATWYHKMARWHLRHQGEDAMRRITDQVRSRLDESALRDYLGEFTDPDWENLNNVKSRFYLESYLYAHQRFPHNLQFVRGLIRFYDNFYKRHGEYQKELEALRAGYFIFAGDIRDDLMRDWMRRGRLTEVPGAIEKKTGGNIAETFMLAWGRRWTGDHEGAVAPLAELTALYPGSPTLVSEGASLDRSLAHSFYGDDPGRINSAVERYRHLAVLYPQNTEYLTHAGEVLAESGNLKEARRIWSGMLDIGRGMPGIYRELATLEWDYYQFDEAAAVLEQIRAIRNDPYLFTTELAAVYESKGDYNAAVTEYVKLHTAQRTAAEALDRLVYLTRARKFGPGIEQAYRAAIGAGPANPQPLLAFTDYLNRVGRDKDALEILASSLARYPNKEFLEECVTTFSNAYRYDLVERALAQLVDVTGGEYEAYGRLATFYESRKMWPKAEGAYLKLVDSVKGDTADVRIKAISDLASFYWRRERYDDALARYREAAMLAEGPRREEMLHATAQRMIQRDKLNDAVGILMTLIEEHPADTSYFITLSQVYTKKNDIEGLVALYKKGLENLRKTPMPVEERKLRISGLRQGLAQSYTALGRYTEALDQHIEIINLFPVEESYLEAAYRFAEEHNLLDRLRGYYAKTATEAYKNYRWQVVLARIDVRRGDRDAARNEYKAAVKLEPQMDWLYTELSNLYIEDGKFAEVIGVYEELAQISDDPAIWHMRIATAMFRAGKRPEAIARARKTIEGNPPGIEPFFQLADLFLTWNEPAQAEETLRIGLERFRADPYRDSLYPQHLLTIIKTLARTQGFEKCFVELKSLREMLLIEVKKKENFRRDRVKTSLRAVDSGLSGWIADELIRHGTAADQQALGIIYKDWAAKYDDNDGVFDLAVNFARSSRLPELERDLYESWLSSHPGYLNRNDKRSRYYAVEWQYQRFLEARRDYAGIEKFVARCPEKNRFDPPLGHVYRINERNDDEIRLLGDAIRRVTLPPFGGFTGDNPQVRRYIQLLVGNNRVQLLRELTLAPAPFTGFYLNEFIAQGRKDLALATVAQACAPKGKLWQQSKSALIYLYFNDTSRTAHELFGSILGIEPIGAAVERQGRKALQGRDWTVYAWHFGKFLDIAKNAEYRHWIESVVEDAPRLEGAYLQVGNYQYDRQRYNDALVQYRLAGELSPASPAVFESQGKALYRMGQKKDALAVLEKLLKPSAPGTYIQYRDVLMDLGETDRGDQALSSYLLQVWAKEIQGTEEVLQTLINAWKNEPARKEALLKQLVSLRPNDLSLPDTVINGKWLEGPALDYFYEAEIGRIEGANPLNEPLRNEWRKKYQAHLIKTGESEKALVLIAENERMEVVTVVEAALVRAEVYLRSDRMDQARAELRKSLGPEPVSFERYDAAINILVSLKMRDEADRWFEESLNLRLKNGSREQKDFEHLAEILLKRGEKERAVGLLERMIRLKPENPVGLRMAAELAAKYELYQQALDWRRRLQPLAPDDDFNRFEIAWLGGKTGKLREALDQSIQLLDEPGFSNPIRYDMAMRLPRLISGDSGLIRDAISRLSEKLPRSGRDSEYLLLANLYLKAGDANAYAATLQEAAQKLPAPYECSLALARKYAETGNLDRAAEFYHQSLRLNPSATQVLIELSELELKRGKWRLAIDALPTDAYQSGYYPEFSASSVRLINGAMEGRWGEKTPRVLFLLKLSEAVEQLNWLDMALVFARDAQSIIESDTESDESPPAETEALPPKKGLFAKWGNKSPAPRAGNLGTRVEKRIEALSEKKKAFDRKRSSTLRITADLEN